jgi:hypothetical protein
VSHSELTSGAFGVGSALMGSERLQAWSYSESWRSKMVLHAWKTVANLIAVLLNMGNGVMHSYWLNVPALSMYRLRKLTFMQSWRMWRST